jgi:galactose mutarotase-like enzyme
MSMEGKMQYVGNTDQLISVQEGRLVGGRADGVRMVHVNNGAGLDATILPDRCMDLYQLRVKGHNVNYISPAGIVAPQYYNDRGDLFLRNFFVGFLTTCGLQNIGSPCSEDGKDYGLHGRLSNTPAQQFSCQTVMQNDNLAVVLSGEMKEAVLFGENLSFRRTITFPYGDNKFCIEDTLVNCGYKKTPLLLLYHFNFGYPLLDPDAELTLDSLSVEPRTQHAADHLKTWNQIEEPQDNFEEMCYYHTLKTDAQGRSSYSLYQPKLDIGVRVQFDGEKLDHFCEWKMFGKGEYVLGLEPMNSLLEGRVDGLKKNLVKFIDPGESITYSSEISFFSKKG